MTINYKVLVDWDGDGWVNEGVPSGTPLNKIKDAPYYGSVGVQKLAGALSTVEGNRLADVVTQVRTPTDNPYGLIKYRVESVDSNYTIIGCNLEIPKLVDVPADEFVSQQMYYSSAFRHAHDNLVYSKHYGVSRRYNKYGKYANNKGGRVDRTDTTNLSAGYLYYIAESSADTLLQSYGKANLYKSAVTTGTSPSYSVGDIIDYQGFFSTSNVTPPVIPDPYKPIIPSRQMCWYQREGDSYARIQFYVKADTPATMQFYYNIGTDFTTQSARAIGLSNSNGWTVSIGSDWTLVERTITWTGTNQGLWVYTTHNAPFEVTGFQYFSQATADTTTVYPYTVGEFPYYDNITDYVLEGDWKFGKQDFDARMPYEGVASIVLNNVGKTFSPEVSTSRYYGKFRTNLLTKIQIQNPSTLEYENVFTGYTRSIELDAGIYSEQRATLALAQGVDSLRNAPFRGALYENKRVDEIVDDLLDGVAFTTATNPYVGRVGISNVDSAFCPDGTLTTKQEGIFTYPLVGNSWTEGRTLDEVLTEILEIEQAHLLWDRDGNLHLYNRYNFINKEVDYTLNLGTTAQRATYVYGADLVNKINLTVRPTQETASSTIWESQQRLLVPAGQLRVVPLVFENEAKIPRSPVALTEDDVEITAYASTRGGRTVNGVTAKVVPNGNQGYELVIENSGDANAYVYATITGSHYYNEGSGYELEYESDPTIFGEIFKKDMDTKIVTDELIGKSMAEYYLARQGKVKGEFSLLTLRYNGSNLSTLLGIKTNTCLQLSEAQTGNSNKAVVIGEIGKFSTGFLSMEYDLAYLEDADYYVVGDTLTDPLNTWTGQAGDGIYYQVVKQNPDYSYSLRLRDGLTDVDINKLGGVWGYITTQADKVYPTYTSYSTPTTTIYPHEDWNELNIVGGASIDNHFNVILSGVGIGGYSKLIKGYGVGHLGVGTAGLIMWLQDPIQSNYKGWSSLSANDNNANWDQTGAMSAYTSPPTGQKVLYTSITSLVNNDRVERAGRNWGLLYLTSLTHPDIRQPRSIVVYLKPNWEDTAWYEQLPDGTNRLRTDFPIQDTVTIRGLYVGDVANAPDTYEESIYSPKTVSY